MRRIIREEHYIGRWVMEVQGRKRRWLDRARDGSKENGLSGEEWYDHNFFILKI